MCKNCWYRIIADVYEPATDRPGEGTTTPQE
jgi:hypothetical protein